MHWSQSMKLLYTGPGYYLGKKGKADHARMGIGGVLISLTLAVSQ